MASKGREKTSLFDLSRERFGDDDHAKIALELSQGSDRAAAIVGAAYVEILLMDVLNSHFQRMGAKDNDALFFSPTAPLQTFSAKIRLGHAIGIYGVKLREHLEIIRRVRNVFGHSVRPRAFDDPLITKELDKLRSVGLADVGLPNLELAVSPSRAKFLANCMDIMLAFDKYARQRHAAGIGFIIGFPDWPTGAPPPLLHKPNE